jgi:hypothetical protein
MLCTWGILIVSHSQCNMQQPWASIGMVVSTRRLGTPIADPIQGASAQSISSTTLQTHLELCISFHFGINGKSRSRLLVQPSYSIVVTHPAPASQSEQSKSLSSQVGRLGSFVQYQPTSMYCLAPRFLHHASTSHIDR